MIGDLFGSWGRGGGRGGGGGRRGGGRRRSRKKGQGGSSGGGGGEGGGASVAETCESLDDQIQELERRRTDMDCGTEDKGGMMYGGGFAGYGFDDGGSGAWGPVVPVSPGSGLIPGYGDMGFAISGIPYGLRAMGLKRAMDLQPGDGILHGGGAYGGSVSRCEKLRAMIKNYQKHWGKLPTRTKKKVARKLRKLAKVCARADAKVARREAKGAEDLDLDLTSLDAGSEGMMLEDDSYMMDDSMDMDMDMAGESAEGGGGMSPLVIGGIALAGVALLAVLMSGKKG